MPKGGTASKSLPKGKKGEEKPSSGLGMMIWIPLLGLIAALVAAGKLSFGDNTVLTPARSQQRQVEFEFVES